MCSSSGSGPLGPTTLVWISDINRRALVISFSASSLIWRWISSRRESIVD